MKPSGRSEGVLVLGTGRGESKGVGGTPPREGSPPDRMVLFRVHEGMVVHEASCLGCGALITDLPGGRIKLRFPFGGNKWIGLFCESCYDRGLDVIIEGYDPPEAFHFRRPE